MQEAGRSHDSFQNCLKNPRSERALSLVGGLHFSLRLRVHGDWTISDRKPYGSGVQACSSSKLIFLSADLGKWQEPTPRDRIHPA